MELKETNRKEKKQDGKELQNNPEARVEEDQTKEGPLWWTYLARL